MNKMFTFIPLLFGCMFLTAQKSERYFLNPNDSTSNMFVAMLPEDGQVNACLFLLNGFGSKPEDAFNQTDIPKYAAKKGIMTVVPLFKTGASFFGSDDASQQSLKEIIELVFSQYKLQNKDFFIGGFSIGGTCAVKYAELAVQNNYPIQPEAVFAIASPLDWERYYHAAKRVVRLSKPEKVNQEVFYMLNRIEEEMKGSPQIALVNYYKQSPYSFSDTTQSAVKNLINIPIMLISEPDIQWWLKERGYDLSYNNVMDHVAMINELQKLGNPNAVLVTTSEKGYRKPDNQRHPHAWSIAEPEMLIKWLQHFEKS
jgi:hypothetical protein